MTTAVPDCSNAEPAGEHWACLGLGSNVEPARYLRWAIGRLRERVAVVAISAAWESPAVGSDGPDYVNAAVLVRTSMRRERLLASLKEIEDQLGRVRTPGMPDRLKIDIDLVIFDSEIVETDLWRQAYRAVPVAELLPQLHCPTSGEPLARAAARLAASLPIKVRPEILAGSPRAGTSRKSTADSTRTDTP
jgi:2-amino-4-hydroxy-6-hydroxymethyldihydropteridine diphosphokinase